MLLFIFLPAPSCCGYDGFLFFGTIRNANAYIYMYLIPAGFFQLQLIGIKKFMMIVLLFEMRRNALL